MQDAASFKSQISQMLGLMDFFIGVMVLLGGLLAATVLYAVATLSVLERTRELATLRAMGCPRAQVVRTITFGNLALAVTGLLLGIGPSLWAVPRVMALFNSELFSLPAVVGTRTWVAALGGCVAVVLIAQWPSIRAVMRLDLATAVRGREG